MTNLNELIQLQLLPPTEPSLLQHIIVILLPDILIPRDSPNERKRLSMINPELSIRRGPRTALKYLSESIHLPRLKLRSTVHHLRPFSLPLLTFPTNAPYHARHPLQQTRLRRRRFRIGEKNRRGQTHAGEVSQSVLELLVFAPFTPGELFRHDVDHAREGVEGGLGVEEGETRASADDVYSPLGVFVADGVADFGFDD